LLNFRTAKLAHEQGHEVLLSVNDFGQLHHKNYRDIEAAGVRVDRRPMPDITGFASRVTYKIKDKLLSPDRHFKNCFAFKPDYIFVNNQGTYDFAGSPLAAWLLKTGIPFALLSQHNPEVNGLPSAWYRTARTIFTKADKTFFISHRNFETASRSLALPLDNAIEVCNPLSSETVSYVPYPASERPTMCMAARFECDVKGQDILLSVLASDYWKQKDWVLNLYGEGPDKAYLEDLIQFYGLGDRVFLKGYRKTIEDIWAENQLLLMVSITEGTPISLLTAVVAGRAAVVTNVGGCAEYVADNKTGFVAEAPTFNSLHEALARAWSHRHEWEAYGLAARKFALEKIDFAPEKTILAAITGQKS